MANGITGNPDSAVMNLNILGGGAAEETTQQPGQEGEEPSQPQQSASRLCPLEEAIYEFDPRSRKRGNKFRVGVNAIRGFDAAIEEYTLVFEDYLTATVGRKFDPPLEFEMVPMTFEDLYQNGESGDMDFFLANPGVFSCLGVELEASALATVIARLDLRGKVHDLDVFAGRNVVFRIRSFQSSFPLPNAIIGCRSLKVCQPSFFLSVLRCHDCPQGSRGHSECP